jgi:hypothetical protein
MISDVLIFLKNALEIHLSDEKNDVAREAKVIFPDEPNKDTLNLKLGAVTVILLNLEQDNVLRSSNLYSRTLPDGTTQKVQPEIRLNLYVLFVANFSQYEESLRSLSKIIQYFQSHHLLTHQNAPSLDEKIEQIVVELVTLSFSEQNDVWGSLHLSYQPSVLYKVKMVVFQDDAPKEMPVIIQKDIRTTL